MLGIGPTAPASSRSLSARAPRSLPDSGSLAPVVRHTCRGPRGSVDVWMFVFRVIPEPSEDSSHSPVKRLGLN